MPIANCGFPPVIPIAGSKPPRFRSGRDALLIKGPTTQVEIGFNPDLFHTDQSVVQQAVASTHAQTPTQLVDALIDTGAGDSCIDETLAQQLQLPLIDQQQGSGIGGTEKVIDYRV